VKIYQVRMSYFDGDHDHGYYESPLFARKEDAEAFKQALVNAPEDDPRRWWSDMGWSGGAGPEEAYIVEIEVCENWDGILESAEEYLHITWT
jgi:hypothetical protein